MYPEDERMLDGLRRSSRAVWIGLVLGVILSLIIGLTGCATSADHTIIVPEGGSIVISPDGSLLTVLDSHGALVWQGDPNK